jgi:hypothetical protein
VVQVGAGLAVEVRSAAPATAGARLAVRLVRDDDLVCVDTSTELEAGSRSAVLRLERLDLAPAG